MLAAFAIVATIASATPAEIGTVLTYGGQVAPVKDDGNPATKQFTVTYVVLEREGPRSLGWVVGESGRGGWTWLDHFGVCGSPANIDGDASAGPSLLYHREDGNSIVELPPPLWSSADRPLERGASWSEGRLDFRVTGQAAKAGRTCWEIDVRSPYGHKRTLWIEQDAPFVVAVRETVFMGQGQEHHLTLELAERKTLAADQLTKLTAAFDGWSKLRELLNWQTRNMRTELSDQQIATLKAELPKLLEARGSSSASLEPLAAIAAAAERDAQGQKNRAGAVAALREALVGQPLGDFRLSELGGQSVTQADLAGKIVVLHFWEYRDSPLEEPYGQTGYLDYLARQRAAAGVAVYGVHVDPRLADEATRRTAAASARKLKSFMNLNYPILLDECELLKRLGDPRPAGGKLPLFVVVGKDGKVAEYRVGLYEAKANSGLSELDAVITKLLASH